MVTTPKLTAVNSEEVQDTTEQLYSTGTETIKMKRPPISGATSSRGDDPAR